jgi:type IV secretory pathway VirB6-like protein
MLRWNIDFVAVLVIAVAMLGFSKASSLKFPADAVESIRMQNAASGDDCQISEVLSRIAYILNQ